MVAVPQPQLRVSCVGDVAGGLLEGKAWYCVHSKCAPREKWEWAVKGRVEGICVGDRLWAGSFIDFRVDGASALLWGSRGRLHQARQLTPKGEAAS
jgi:hypothetical protein